MADRSKIEWTDASWNPIRARNKANGKIGWHCEHATTGCEFCYAEGFNRRLGTGLPFKPGHRKDVELFLDEKMLTQPLRWERPRMIFVCSMTDLFADFVPDEWIDRVFAVMALSPQHQFQVLTKRAARMREYAERLDNEPVRDTVRRIVAAWPGNAPVPIAGITFPLPNVWLGVSAERQAEADRRIPELLATPAAVRFVSLEPLLGPIDLNWWPYRALSRRKVKPGEPEDPWRVLNPGLDWVIVGGESGQAARPMHPDWARSLRDQCTAAGVPFFFKQWGEWIAGAEAHARGIIPARQHAPWGRCQPAMAQIGKARAGRLLDGREWNGLPR